MQLEYVEYLDDQICMKLPKQLRQKKGIRFFQGKLIRGRLESQVNLAIDIDLNEQQVETHRQILLMHPVNGSWMGNEMRLERRGSCEFGDNGVELIGSDYNNITKQTQWHWKVLYQLNGRYIFIYLAGGFNELTEFEAMGREIITSLQFK